MQRVSRVGICQRRAACLFSAPTAASVAKVGSPGDSTNTNTNDILEYFAGMWVCKMGRGQVTRAVGDEAGTRQRANGSRPRPYTRHHLRRHSSALQGNAITKNKSGLSAARTLGSRGEDMASTSLVLLELVVRGLLKGCCTLEMY
jgi:hypothetical protein